MRRPRSKLEVSTFPFLAVLLCAMGSLMLLLFIMDRRAKIAARYRVTEELQTRQARTEAEEEARKADWEKAKQQLHRSLQQQHAQLLAESKGIQQNVDETSKKLGLVQTRHGDLEQQINGETAKVGVLLLEIESFRAGLQQADKKETMSKAELLEAARELGELERAFQQLKALKEREKQVHSVVPYRGKRGDMRPPIYVECVRDGALFHPEKTLLRAWDFTPAAIRGEVERRFGPLAVQKLTKEKRSSLSEEAKGPYVLFLVRPDGIGNYYKAQSALKGYQLDFGYELVDEGWSLDFGGETQAKNAPPSRINVPWKKDDEAKPIVAMKSSVGEPGTSLAQGTGALPSGTGNVMADKPGPPSLFPRETSASIGIGNAGLPILPPPDPPTGFSGAASSGSGAPPTIGNLSSGGPNTGMPIRPPTFVPILKGPSLVPIASAGGATGPSNSGTPNGSGPTSNSAGAGSLNETSQRVNPTGVGAPNGSGKTANPAGEATAPTGNLVNPPTPGTSDAGKRPIGSPDASGTPGEANGDSYVKPLPTFGADTRKKPIAASPLSRLLGNKEFIITIDCRNDSVTVNPSGLTYRWTTSNLQTTDKALIDTVTTLIARRQASVRPGEPSYRPQIRFHVSSEGLRSYYHVYPLLEHLRVPMTRENVEE